MKIKACSFVLLLFAALPTQAQFNLWVKGGINWNTVSIQNQPPSTATISADRILGYHFGFYSKIKLTDKLSLIPEVQFIQRGYIHGTSYIFPLPEATITLNYIDVPVVLSYNVYKSIAIDVGPSVGFKTSTRIQTGTASSADASETYSAPIDYGANFGIRMDILERFSVITRYYLGFKSVTSSSPSSPSYSLSTEDTSFYNRNLHVGLAYRLK